MVFFTCSECGQSVKKNQVEKHCSFQCRNCKSLACMDCGTEFWGDDYKTHTKCITEDEKYGGKNYTPKPSANKGEVKQEMWIEHVKNTIATKDLSGPLSELLQKVIEFPNIPRKKSKFQKFVENSLKVKNQKLISEAWDIFAESTQDESTNNTESRTGANGQVKRPAAPLDEEESSAKKVCPDQGDDGEESESDSQDMEEESGEESGNEEEKVQKSGGENDNEEEMEEGSDGEEESDSVEEEQSIEDKRKCNKCNQSGHIAKNCPSETNTYQSGGDKSCFKCGKAGHMSRECTEGGGKTPGTCFNCNEEGHQSRNCPQKRQGGRQSSGACYNCNEEGHQSRDCPQKRQGGRASSGACYNCNEEGHQSRDCPQKKQGGRASFGGVCYNCNEEGHQSRDCPQKKQGGRAFGGSCYNCNEEGHQSRDCPQKKQGGRGSSGACFNCNEEGHQSRNCPQKKQGGRASSGGACFNCNEEGHQSRNCPQKKQGGRASSGACFRCNEEGHQSRNCPNGDNKKGGSGKSFKFTDEDYQVKENGKEVNGDKGASKMKVSFDFNKACEKVLEKFPDGLPRKQIKKQVMAQYKATVGDDTTLPKETLKKHIKEALTAFSIVSPSVS